VYTLKLLKLSHISAVLVVSAVVATSVGFATGWAADSDESRPEPPPTPSWVREDGTVDEAKLPGRMPVLGSDGKPVLDENGRQVTIDVRSTPPAEGPAGQRRGSTLQVDPNGAVGEKVRPHQFG